ncbi:MAG: polyamine aminopropyltransferase [Peptostreptococcaceae bacterium]|jgi:spermidine synthase|nr:polyamine aminopropyltransferase [Peptostreptococcaceae bacterium]
MNFWYYENHQDTVTFGIKVDKHLYTNKSDFQQIDIFENDVFGKFMTLDGLMMVTEKDEFIYHDMITHIPLAVNPNIKRVLVIGGGDGGTVRELTRYKHITKIDMVEIDELVVKASIEHLPITSCKLDDKRVNLYYQDGLEFVKGKENEYDLILVDSTDPIGPGEGLFTREFYRDCYKALSEDGILINQNESPYYESYRHEMKRANEKIKEVFDIVNVYQFHMPTYPSGHWLFGFASKTYHPIKDLKKDIWENFGIKTKYYNTDIHVGSFMLPTYVKELLEDESK